MKIVTLLVMLLCAASLQAAGLYKWVDKDGKVQYTDTPPPAGTKNVEQRKLTPNVIPTSEAPFATQDAVKKFPVTLWANDCGEFCNKARELLNTRGVPFTETNPQNRDVAEAFKKIAGAEPIVPIVQIGTLRTLRGFSESDWHQALDAAGYPKSGPATKPAAKPAADGQKK